MTKWILGESFGQSRRHRFWNLFIANLALSFVTLSTATLSIIVSQVGAFAATIYVPDDFPTIQGAVNVAAPGDTIIVRDGTYTENVDVNKDYLTIKSESGAEATIVQGSQGIRVFEVLTDYVTISGFTITKASPDWWCAGVWIEGSYCNISDNIIISNGGYGGYGGYGIRVQKSVSTIANNIISDNWCGIQVLGSSHAIINNNVSDNKSSGIYLSDFSLVANNIVLNNYYGIGIWGSSNIIINNTISNNSWNGLGVESGCNNIIYLNKKRSKSSRDFSRCEYARDQFALTRKFARVSNTILGGVQRHVLQKSARLIIRLFARM